MTTGRGGVFSTRCSSVQGVANAGGNLLGVPAVAGHMPPSRRVLRWRGELPARERRKRRNFPPSGVRVLWLGILWLRETLAILPYSG